MGCTCSKKLKTEEEVDFDPKNTEQEVNNTSNLFDIENNKNYNDNIKIENLKSPVIGQKSKTFVSAPTKDEDIINIQIFSELENEDFKNLKNYKQINTNLITKEELNTLLSNIQPFNDNIIVEIRPTTLCENKSIYFGEWDIKNNIRHGRGIQIWSDGSKYLGQWRDNKASGKGKLIHQNGDIYEGDWEFDKPNGFGEYFRSDGSKYKGFWKNDQQDGKGEEIWADGSKYEGMYKNGKKSGNGIFIWPDGNVYEGNFENNFMDGKGKYKFNDKRIYEGDWCMNKIEGNGILTWPDGRKYEGEFKNFKRDGFGVFTDTDGKQYKGEWKEGKQNGKGEIYLPKQNIWKKGIWEDGKRLEWIS
jgi:hypothetical protein